jgi:hypothetical protein
MWICLNDSFLSIVDKGDPSGDTLLVRARREGDIGRVFPEAVVSINSGSDYAYRARLPRERVVARIAEAVRSIDYGNFKATVAERRRHDVYMDIWSVLARDQDGTRGR